MKTILSVAFIYATLFCHAQTDQQNQDKYWKYRERLKNKFVKIGPLSGESIPMACRIPGYAYGGTLNPGGTQLQWKDATITLGYYLIVLSTEFKLLKNSGENYHATLNELYYALNAINRLDLNAESYLSDGNVGPNINGFFLRDDVPYTFWQNWQNDGPMFTYLFSDPGNPVLSDSDYNGLNDGDGSEQSDPNQGNAESLDQMTSLLTGLMTVWELVDDEVVQPTIEDTPINVRSEARAIMLRLIHYVMQNEFDNEFSPIFKILDQDGNLVTRGPDCTASAWPLIYMGIRLNDPYILDHFGEMMLSTEVPIMAPALELYFAIASSNWPCMNSLQESLVDHINEDPNKPFVIAHIPLGLILQFLNKAQNEHIDLEVHSYSACTSLNFSEFLQLNEVDLELPGWCDDIIYNIIVDNMLPSLMAMNQTLGVFLDDFLTADWPQLGEDICIPSGSLNHDNVHIILELMTTSAMWSDYNYLLDVTEMDFPYINLLYPVLNNNSQPYQQTIKDVYKSLLDGAPCEGPWQDPLDISNHAPNNWASACNLFKGFGETGPQVAAGTPWLEYSGYFPGIDYMVLHNLYYLLWQNDLDPYVRSQTCECSQSFVEQEESWSPLQVKAQFPDYKAKGIPIESYLTHDFTAHTPEAILEVRNDLIICSPHQGEVVELTLRDGASMNLYNGNKIVVNSGNVLTLRDGSVLNAGLDDTTYDGDNNSYPAPEIFLEENAKMIVQNYSSIKIYDGLRIHLKQGSTFKIADSDCSPMGEWGITFISDGGTITMDRSTVVARSNFSTGTHLTNTSVQIDKSTLSIPENSSNYWIADNCNIEFFSSSNLNLSTLFQVNGGKLVNYTNNVFNLKGGFLELNDDAKFYWNGGQFFLQQNHSYLRFNDSEFHLAPNTTFEPKHEDFESGYIEFSNSYDVNFFSGDGSAFILRGDGEDDLMLKINHSANLWNASSSNGDLIFENCKVDLSDHGGIWIGQRFKAIDVNFIDLVTTYEYLGGNIHVWYNDCSIKECYLDGVRIHGHDSKMYFMQSQFKNKASGIESRSGSYKIDFCGFESCHVESYSLELASSISNSLFQYSDYAQVDCSGCSPFVFDESSVDLRIAQSTFRDGRSAVTKYGGKLSLRCNWFKDLSNDAVKMAAGYLNMSTTSAAGYNIFENVRSCLKLDFAEGVDLYNGYNNLSGFIINCIYGTMNKICIGSCETTVDATRNYWGAPINIFPPNVQTSGLYTPDMTPVVIDVYGSDGPAICYQILCTSGCPGCKINFKDYNPTWRACGIDKPIVREKKSMVIENNPDPSLKQSPGNGAVGQLRSETYEVGNPLINTASFNDVLLDSALVYAALQMELYDSLGNDLVAVDLFNEILTSPLDRTNSDIRWRMEWGRYNMKIALENMFTDNELLESNNTESFEYPVQQYVDVLNIMTDSILTDSTYKEQFYLEIDKGQLFRTLGNPQMARYVYTHLDDCDLDSLEQARLNNWLAEVDLEISIRQQYVDDELSPDSISYAVDSSGYTPAVPLELSDFYFGLWINSPQSVTFVACGGNPVYRSVQTVSSGMAIYPNPTSEGFFITTNEPGNYTLRITDMFGRLIYERQQYFEADTPVNVDRQDLLSGGQYLITLSNHEGTMKQKLIVN